MSQSVPMKCHKRQNLKWIARTEVKPNQPRLCVSEWKNRLVAFCLHSCCMATWKGQGNSNNLKNEASEGDVGRSRQVNIIKIFSRRRLNTRTQRDRK